MRRCFRGEGSVLTPRDGAYAAFGKVLSGMDVAQGIVGQRTDGRDRPLTPQVIASIRVDTHGVEYPFDKL